MGICHSQCICPGSRHPMGDFSMVTSTQLNSTTSYTYNDMLVSARYRREGRCRWKDAAEATKTRHHLKTQLHLTKCRSDIHNLPPSVTALPLHCNLHCHQHHGRRTSSPTKRANVPSSPVPPPSSFIRIPSFAFAGFLQPPLYDQHIYLRRTWDGLGLRSTHKHCLYRCTPYHPWKSAGPGNVTGSASHSRPPNL